MTKKIYLETLKKFPWLLHFPLLWSPTLILWVLSQKMENFFEKGLFYSSLNDSEISTEDYENVKKFCSFSKLKNFVELDRIYDFQDTIILCEIFEQRSELLQKLFKYNLKKCKAVSQAVYIVRKVSVPLHFQQTLTLSEYLKQL